MKRKRVEAPRPHSYERVRLPVPVSSAGRLRQVAGLEEALFVAVSGHGNEADVRRCQEAGIDCHFLKPVDPAELEKALGKAERLGVTPAHGGA